MPDLPTRAYTRAQLAKKRRKGLQALDMLSRAQF
jgi:hypothetical protein